MTRETLRGEERMINDFVESWAVVKLPLNGGNLYSLGELFETSASSAVLTME
jgi:hypothetical protein